MPWARHASSSVAPSGTRTVAPSIVTSTSRFGVSRNTAVMSGTPYQAEARGRLDRRGGGLAEPADRGVPGDHADLAEQCQLGVQATPRRPGGQPGQQLLLADRAD